MQTRIKTTMFILVILGLTNFISYSQAKGIATEDGKLLIPSSTIISNFNETLTRNDDGISISEVNIERSNLVFIGRDGAENPYRYDLELENVEGILYLPTPNKRGNEIKLTEGTIWSFALFYSKINQ